MTANTTSEGADGSDAPSGEDAAAARPTSLADEDDLDGCGICASMEPVIGNVARGVEADLAVGLVNPRDDPPLVERFDVRSVPLFVLFVDGEPVARRAEGFIPGEDLAAWVDEHAA